MTEETTATPPGAPGQSEELPELDAPDPSKFGSSIGDIAARLFGWLPGMVIDPSVFTRWLWLRRRGRGGKRTLDAGCGSGWFALYMASRGNDVTGISFNEIANEAATRRAEARGVTGVRFIQGDLRELDTIGPPLGSFEQIMCFETIEHIQNDEKLVRDLAALLEPGGQLLLTTPSDDHPPLIGEEVSETEDGGHVRFGYSHARLRELCEGAGLRMVAEDRLCGWIGQKTFDIGRRATYVIGFRAAMALIVALRPLQAFDPLVTRLLRYPELHVAIVAEKPAT
jgi:2-polyprenyl-3-methyl-5-hydroxy-6-metoxy-1,4-benzoquinol methylase